jgi:4-hydroxy-tetrahydrodipicolinate synthase
MFKGSNPALVTPFTENGEVDKDAFINFVEWQISEGSHGLVPVGTSGESPTLSHEEHKAVVELCVQTSNGRVPVMAGCGSNDTVAAIDFIQHAEKVGADAALVVTPYYNKPNQRGLYAHFSAIANASSLPIYIYNIPGRSVIDMTSETMAKLNDDFTNIVGVKDATAKLDRVSEIRQLCGSDFIQLSGEDATTIGYMGQGGQGCISVTANVAPALCSQLLEACMNGDYKTALSIQDRLFPLHSSLFIEPNPAAAKYALSKLGKMNEHQRLPLVPLTDETKAIVDEALKHAGLIN